MRCSVCRWALRGAVTLAISGGSLLGGAGPAVAGTRLVVPPAETACSANTCQVIDSSGDTVSDWYTETTASSSVCTYARYYANGTLVAETGTKCLSSGQEATANWSDPGTFSSGTNLCSSWYGIAGEPCTKL